MTDLEEEEIEALDAAHWEKAAVDAYCQYALATLEELQREIDADPTVTKRVLP